MQWVRNDDWVGTEVDGSLVMVNVDSGKYVALNETATAIWEALETPRDQREIAGYLRERFEVPEERLDAAVAQAIGSMRALDLVTSAGQE